MNLTCFWVIARISPSGDNVTLDDLSGMHQYAPAYAMALAVGAFALVGMPPTMGFTGNSSFSHHCGDMDTTGWSLSEH